MTLAPVAYLDVSLPLGPDLLTWPGDPPLAITPRLRLSAGDPANVSELTLGTHTGTHVDPPVHFIDGTPGIDAIRPDLLIGEALVADARGLRGALGPAELEGLSIPEGTTRLLLRTDNSDLWQSLPIPFPEDYVCVSPEGASWIADQGIGLIGVDFLSVERRGAAGHPVHVELLSRGVIIVEGLNLADAEPGRCRLICLPLRIEDGDGGPARAVLELG